MFIVLSSCHSHYESSLGSHDEYRTAPGGSQPLVDQANRLESQTHLQVASKRYPPSPIYYYYSARKLILISPSGRG